MCTPFDAVGRLTVTPPLPGADAEAVCRQHPSWWPCAQGCCLLPDWPDAASTRRLLAALPAGHRVSGCVAWDDGQELLALLVADGLVTEAVLWRHPAPCRDELPLPPVLLREAG